MRIIINNIVKSPLRTTVLTIIEATMAIALFSAIIVSTAFDTGLTSLRDRLGADIIVVPKDVTTVNNYQKIVLDHDTNYFYFNDDSMSELYSYTGISQITKQLFIASTSASCCSSEIEIIGYDPATDFVIKPWLDKKVNQSIGDNQIVIGSAINLNIGDTIRFYDIECKVIGKMAPTGTSYDYCAFTSMDNAKNIIKGSIDKDLNKFKDLDVESLVSCVLMKVADKDDIESIVAQINMLSPNFTALTNTSITKETADSIDNIKSILTFSVISLCIVMWITLLLLYFFVYGDRIKDFAVLKMVGISELRILVYFLLSVVVQSIISTIIGIGVVLLSVTVLHAPVQSALDVPILLPSIMSVFEYALVTCGIMIVSGLLASVFVLHKLSKTSISVALKE